jgi:hypothetical protein
LLNRLVEPNEEQYGDHLLWVAHFLMQQQFGHAFQSDLLNDASRFQGEEANDLA